MGYPYREMGGGNSRLCDGGLDRKSTRLNSSHGYISYAVFCLKKKNNIKAGVHLRALIALTSPLHIRGSQSTSYHDTVSQQLGGLHRLYGLALHHYVRH